MTQPRVAFDSRLTDMLGDLEHRVVVSETQRPIPIPGTDTCTCTCVSCDTCTCTCIACEDDWGSLPTPVLPGGGGINPGGGGAVRPGF